MSSFSYDHNAIQNLEKSMSSERLSTYLEHAHNEEDALKLYIWNAEVSAAFHLPLQNLEITLRNALHETLCQHFSREDWYDKKIESFNKYDTNRINEAKKKVKEKHQIANPPHVVAELSFGFWLSLIHKRHHRTLWESTLYKAFSHCNPLGDTINAHYASLFNAADDNAQFYVYHNLLLSARKEARREIHKHLNGLRLFRNRIAHHEPVFKRELEEDYKSIITSIHWLCPTTAEWTQHHCHNLPNLLAKRKQRK